MEAKSPTTQVLERAIKEILTVVDNPTREGLKDTPRRVARMYDELLKPQEFNFTTFDANSYDQMIVSKAIPFYSLCEHHMIPFFGYACIGYIPGKQMAGLSKLARAVEYFARHLQVQERMTQDIGNFLLEKLQPQGLGVILIARHLCQEMRGIKKPGIETTTSALFGSMKLESARKEFLEYAKRSNTI